MFLNISKTNYLLSNLTGKVNFSKSLRYYGTGCDLLIDCDCEFERTFSNAIPLNNQLFKNSIKFGRLNDVDYLGHGC